MSCWPWPRLRDKLSTNPNIRVHDDARRRLLRRCRARAQRRRVQADLFVSIHADAAFHDAAGARRPVFACLTVRPASSAAARWLAAQGERRRPGGRRERAHRARTRRAARALLDMSTTAQIRTASSSAAGAGAKSAAWAGCTTRVEQAGFAVLKAPDIPSSQGRDRLHLNPTKKIACATRPTDRLVNALHRHRAFTPAASAPHAERLIGA